MTIEGDNQYYPVLFSITPYIVSLTVHSDTFDTPYGLSQLALLIEERGERVCGRRGREGGRDKGGRMKKEKERGERERRKKKERERVK